MRFFYNFNILCRKHNGNYLEILFMEISNIDLLIYMYSGIICLLNLEERLNCRVNVGLGEFYE